MYSQMIDYLSVTSYFLRYIYRIIKIFGILAVYGYYFKFCQIKPVFDRSLYYLRGNFFNFFKYRLRKFFFYSISLCNRKYINSFFIFRAENFYNFTLRAMLGITITCDFCNHLIAFRYILTAIFRYIDIRVKPGVIRHYKSKIFTSFKCTYDGSYSSFNYLYYLAFSAFPPAFCKKLNCNSISVKGIAYF